MHSTEGSTTANGPPQFLSKLWKLVEDEKYDNLISWGSTGTTFIIRNQTLFAKEVLPLYYKHNNMASFIRQLNMYGFRKVSNIEQGGLRCDKDELEFQHECFVKDHEFLLPLIKRKISTGKGQENSTGTTGAVNQIMHDVSQLKTKQENLDNTLLNLKRENEIVWREVASLRQKHAQQQQIINRMVHFLITMVQNSNRVGNKRKIPLMFTEPPLKRDKNATLSRHFSLEETKSPEMANTSSSGPVIHDVTDSEGNESDYFVMVDPTTVDPTAETKPEVKFEETEEKEDSEVKTTNEKPTLSDVLNSCDIASTSGFSLTDQIAPEAEAEQSTIAIPNKWDNCKSDLQDSLQAEELKSLLDTLFTNYSPFMDLRNREDILPSILSDDNAEEKNEITGTEIVQYHPSLLDLAEEESPFTQCNNTSTTMSIEPGLMDSDLMNLMADSEVDLFQNSENNLGDTLNTPDPIMPNISIEFNRAANQT